MMQSKLESLDNYEKKSNECDCIWLLKEIQGITHRFEGTRNVFISLDDAWTGYYAYQQGANQSLHEYLMDYQSLVQVLEPYGAAIGAKGPYIESVKDRIKETFPDLTPAEYRKKEITAAKQQSVAIGFLKRADKRRYGALWSELENNFTRGQDHYPADLTNAYNLLLNYKAPPVPRQPRREPAEDDEVSGVSFLQNGATTPGSDGITHERVKCYNCNTYGHYSGSCPNEDNQEAVQMLQVTEENNEYLSEFSFLHIDQQAPGAFTFAQAAAPINIIPNTWILLDSQSTVSVFKNRALLTNVRKSDKTLRVHTNGGTQLSTEMGHVKNFGDVWYNNDSLANILSMAEVRKICRITMDTSVEAAMNVHRRDGSLMKFTEYKSGLYYFDTGAPITNNTNSTSNSQDYLFLNTVEDNKRQYTRREIEGADKARDLYRKIGRPSEKEFNDILQNNLIRNCPITSDDAKRALRIYGPDIATLKGKTVKKQNTGIPNYQAVQIPAPIIAQYTDVRLFIDIFWVNGSPYFHTISEWIKFRTVAQSQRSTTETREHYKWKPK